MNEVVVVLCRIFPPSMFHRGKKKPQNTTPQQMLSNFRQPGLNSIQVTGQIWQSLERQGMELRPFTYIPFRHNDGGKSCV